MPEPARRLAEEEGLPLADAYLRFLHRERQRADEERERQRQAAARSSGPLAGERAEPQPEQEAFRRAFEKALSEDGVPASPYATGGPRASTARPHKEAADFCAFPLTAGAYTYLPANRRRSAAWQ